MAVEPAYRHMRRNLVSAFVLHGQSGLVDVIQNKATTQISGAVPARGGEANGPATVDRAMDEVGRRRRALIAL